MTLGTGGDGQRRPRQGSTHSLGGEGGRRKCRPSATPSVCSWGHSTTAGNGGQMEEQIREEARALMSSVPWGRPKSCKPAPQNRSERAEKRGGSSCGDSLHFLGQQGSKNQTETEEQPGRDQRA